MKRIAAYIEHKYLRIFAKQNKKMMGQKKGKKTHYWSNNVLYPTLYIVLFILFEV